VFVESYRPDTLEKMGLAPDVLHAANPKLVIVRISGFGQAGPYRRRPGFGTLVEGMSASHPSTASPTRSRAAADLPRRHDRRPVRRLGRHDRAARGRGERRKGQVIDLPLLDPLFHVLGPQARTTGSRQGEAAHRQPLDQLRAAQRLPLQGRAVRVPVGLDAEDGRAHLRAIGRADLIDNPRYRTNADRVKHAEELDAIIGEFVAARTQEENVAFFEQAEVTIGPIYDVRQILEDPHVIEREILAEYPDPQMGDFPMHPVVPRLMGTPGSIRTMAPGLGDHNRALLREVGVDDARYAELLAAGVVAEGERRESPRRSRPL
jgi:formyl-CoA transferase